MNQLFLRFLLPRQALACLLAMGLPGLACGQVMINEVMADNRGAVPNGNDFPDYVELHNLSLSPLSLANLSLTDTTNNPVKFRFPAGTPPLQPGGFVVVWCDTNNAAPGLHAGFSLKDSGELVALYDTNGPVRQDLVVFGLQAAGLPIGRVPDGNGFWQLTTPTPNLANQTVSLGSPLTLKFNEWLATNSAGIDEDWFELYNPSSSPVALGGLVFSDELGAPVEQAVAALSFIGARSFVQFFADSDPSKGADHADLRLSSSSGETLTLYDTDRMTIIDRVMFGAQTRDISQGRLPDGGTNIVFFPTNFVTPAAANKFQPLTNIVINEVLTHTDDPLEDAIELHNPTAVSVDVGNWWLSNSRDEPQKFRIPAGTFIPAGGFKVFYEYAGVINGGGFNPSGTGDSPSFTLNSAHGDEVYLSTGNSTGNLTGFRRSVDFGAAENAVSFGRYQTSDGVDFVALSQRTFGVDNLAPLSQFRTGTGLSNATPKVGPIVIRQLMYHPPDLGLDDNTLDEFIELQNITAATVLLYDPQAPTNSWKLANGVEFIFPPGKSVTSGGTLFVVNFDPATNTTQLAAFRSKFGVSTNIPIFGPYDGKLDNRGESIDLLKPDKPQGPTSPDVGFVPYFLVDRVKYFDTAPWPTAPDGTGASLQRKDPSAYGNDPANWKAGDPVTCLYSLSATNALFPSNGGGSNVMVVTQSGCPWASTNTNSWITIAPESSSGAGMGMVSYSVAPYSNTVSRIGRFTIAGRTFIVTQGGPDKIKPTVTISSPAASARLTNGSISLLGTARDNFAVGRVEYQFGNGPFLTATGTTSWAVQLALAPGTNTVRARSVDLAGNESVMATRTFTLLAPLTVLTNGNGKVTPSSNGKYLEVGKPYTLTALPGIGQVFSNWTGNFPTNSARLSFLMQTGLVLQANFVPNPFVPVKGAYNGLFSETNGVLHESSGFFNATVTDRGSFTGTLQSNGKRLPLSGQFDLEGRASRMVARPGTNSLLVDLQLDLAGGTEQITGSIAGGSWLADLTADRAVFNARTNSAANYAGRYTLVIPGDTNDLTSPGGDGFGTVTIDTGGNVTFSGSLAEGSVASQRVPLSKRGEWPLYVTLYAGKGSLLSWVSFTNSLADDLTGLLSWIKPALPLTKYYTNGFTNLSSLTGSTYVAPGTNHVLKITNGVVTLTGGYLSQPLTNEVDLLANNKLTNKGPNKMVFTVTPATGLFAGSVTPTGTTRAIPIKGVLLQKQNFGAGYFLDTNRSGRVFVGTNAP